MDYAVARQHVLTLLPEGGEGAEIGVWQGDFSAEILSRARPRRLHLIDPWQVRHEPSHAMAWYGAARGVDMEAVARSVEARFVAEIATGQAVVHRAVSAEVLPRLGPLDFVYVDGDHAYQAVRADLDMAFAAVRPGGLICIDDHMTGKWWGDGVVRASNEFLGACAAEVEVVFCDGYQLVVRRR